MGFLVDVCETSVLCRLTLGKELLLLVLDLTDCVLVKDYVYILALFSGIRRNSKLFLLLQELLNWIRIVLNFHVVVIIVTYNKEPCHQVVQVGYSLLEWNEGGIFAKQF